MSGTGLPQPLADALEAVRVATSEILTAASPDDTDALRDAVERRGLAIRHLAPIVQEMKDTLDAGQRRTLDAEAEQLLRQGRDAEVAAASILESARVAKASFERGAVAIRRYASPTDGSGGLDHSA
jgi:hypothetical protein